MRPTYCIHTEYILIYNQRGGIAAQKIGLRSSWAHEKTCKKLSQCPASGSAALVCSIKFQIHLVHPCAAVSMWFVEPLLIVHAGRVVIMWCWQLQTSIAADLGEIYLWGELRIWAVATVAAGPEMLRGDLGMESKTPHYQATQTTG